MRRGFTFFLVNTVELITAAILFLFAPVLAHRVDSWMWIASITVVLLIVHFSAFYLLRHNHPTVWLWSMPLFALIVIILANINSNYLIDGLGLYGVYSRFSPETDVVLTFTPFYVDAFLFSALILVMRLQFFIPIHMITKQNDVYKQTQKTKVADL